MTDHLTLLGVDLYGYQDGSVGVSGADEISDRYRQLEDYSESTPTTGRRAAGRAAVVFDDGEILPLPIDHETGPRSKRPREPWEPWKAIRDLPYSCQAIPQTVALVTTNGPSRRVELYTV